jgi:lipopolysaccharide/colanic/teichoic acid biosynthesis glycosyltransferase
LGPEICFRQHRVGRNGVPFQIIKFRSMRPDRRHGVGDYVGTDRRHNHKSPHDPRHTRLGRVIRKSSLDELPQLINVLKGEMSLVGPRPELVTVATRHDLIDHPRHRVRPGITGLWQVSPARSALLHEDMQLDIGYVSRVTFLGDLRILLRTIPAVIRARGQ